MLTVGLGISAGLLLVAVDGQVCVVSPARRRSP